MVLYVTRVATKPREKKRKKRVEEISHGEREKIREEEMQKKKKGIRMEAQALAAPKITN